MDRLDAELLLLFSITDEGIFRISIPLNIQDDPNKLKRWPKRTSSGSTKPCAKWQPRHPYRLGAEQTRSSSLEMDLEGLVEGRLDMTQQCAETTPQSKNQPCPGLHPTQHGQDMEGGNATLPLYSPLMRPSSIRRTRLHKNSVYKRKDKLSLFVCMPHNDQNQSTTLAPLLPNDA